MEIVIGVYEETGELVGYKADTFWTLTAKREHAKIHDLENGKIHEHLIRNLISVLNPSDAPIIGPIQTETKRKYFSSFETFLLGYEACGSRIYTHRIFNADVQELSDNDLFEISERMSK